ncbi:energy transducer TonB [Spartinivicinus ruber]|uniref:energy transducer TonB n=1 Tax=Spartinivicinus ruber TaxID=2683272 RepID=UPI0013D65711|nr:energy transducer TonB [Spartinivicinus ruber]
MNQLLLFALSVSVLLHGWLWLYAQQQPEVKPRAMAALSAPLKLQHVSFKQRVVQPVEAQEQPKPEPQKEIAKVEPKPTPKPISKKVPAKKPAKKIVKPKPAKKPPVKVAKAKPKPKPKTPKPVVAKKTEKPIKKPQKRVQEASTTPVVAKKSFGMNEKVVTSRPDYKRKVKPDYPSRALRRNQQGKVIIEVVLSPNGVNEKVSVKKSSGYPLLDRAAVKAIKRSEFVPQMLAGRAVTSTFEVPVEFKLN